jgi:hypothetical protein
VRWFIASEVKPLATIIETPGHTSQFSPGP